MTEATPPLSCPVDDPTLSRILEHEDHRIDKKGRYRRPKVRIGKRLRLSPCAVPGISLTDYSRSPSDKGWGSPCSQARTTITLSNGVRLTVASRVARLVTLIMNANIAQGYVYRQVDSGAYNCRYISGTTVWSQHAWALAVDENWQSNPYVYPLRTDKPGWLCARWNRYGFAWGGDYTGKKDAMHFEFMGSPEQADAATALAEVELGGGVAPTPGPVPLPPVVDNSAQIRKDQFDLTDTGFPCTQDGVWGPESIAACKAFQFAARIGVDGICGDNTRANLHKVPSWRSAGPTVADDPGGYTASQWQQKLKDHGWRISVDNAWGAHSKSILAQFQAEKGIASDGNRGPQSWTCLYCTVN